MSLSKRLREAMEDLLHLLEEPEFQEAGEKYFDRTTSDCGLLIDDAKAVLDALPTPPTEDA